jgi:hypothetical protein
MSKVSIKGNTSGTGTFTIEAPASNSNRTLTLPDEAGTVLTSATSIPQAQIASALNATGSAPIYACRAWVNFDGTTTPPTIRASGNVSSVARDGTGLFTVNFATAMPDANYTFSGAARYSVGSTDSTSYFVRQYLSTGKLVDSFKCQTAQANSSASSVQNYDSVDLQFFR